LCFEVNIWHIKFPQIHRFFSFCLLFWHLSKFMTFLGDFTCHINECGNVCDVCRLATKSLFNLYMKPPANPQQYNHIASYKHGYELTPLLFLLIVDFHLNVLTDKKHSNFLQKHQTISHKLLYISFAPFSSSSTC
jgi:hypothetical protein